MTRRKGEPKRTAKDYYYEPYGPGHPLARAIAEGQHWFAAWCFQHTLNQQRLKRATGITPDRAAELLIGAAITEIELDALAVACGVPPSDIIASMSKPVQD